MFTTVLAPFRSTVLAAGLLAASLGAAALGQGESAPPTVHLYDPATDSALRTLGDEASVALSALSTREVGVLADVDAATGSVVFEVDGRIVATVDDAPFVLTFAVDADGRLRFARSSGTSGASDVRIASSEDDAEQFLRDSSRDPEAFPAGFTYVTSSDLELGHDPEHAPQLVALRFSGVDVPLGAAVGSAEVVFTADGDSTGPLRLTVRGEASATSAPFEQDPNGQGSGGIASRDVTAAVRSWDLGQQGAWLDGRTYASPDLADIVQEIVSLEGWQNEGTVTLLVSSSEDGLRRARSFDGDRANAPLLRIGYDVQDDPLILPRDRHSLTVTPYTESGGQGDAGTPAELRFEVVERPVEPADPTAEPDPESDPDAVATPGGASEPKREPEPPVRAGTPTRTRLPLVSSVDGGSIGTTVVSIADSGRPLITISSDRPFGGPVRLEARSGACETAGERVAALTIAIEAPGLITATTDLSAEALLAGDVGLHVVDADSGTSLACSPLGETR